MKQVLHCGSDDQYGTNVGGLWQDCREGTVGS